VSRAATRAKKDREREQRRRERAATLGERQEAAMRERERSVLIDHHFERCEGCGFVQASNAEGLIQDFLTPCLMCGGHTATYAEAA
jgi:hypothetical protein